MLSWHHVLQNANLILGAIVATGSVLGLVFGWLYKTGRMPFEMKRVDAETRKLEAEEKDILARLEEKVTQHALSTITAQDKRIEALERHREVQDSENGVLRGQVRELRRELEAEKDARQAEKEQCDELRDDHEALKARFEDLKANLDAVLRTVRLVNPAQPTTL